MSSKGRVGAPFGPLAPGCPCTRPPLRLAPRIETKYPPGPEVLPDEVWLALAAHPRQGNCATSHNETCQPRHRALQRDRQASCTGSPASGALLRPGTASAPQACLTPPRDAVSAMGIALAYGTSRRRQRDIFGPVSRGSNSPTRPSWHFTSSASRLTPGGCCGGQPLKCQTSMASRAARSAPSSSQPP